MIDGICSIKITVFIVFNCDMFNKDLRYPVSIWRQGDPLAFLKIGSNETVTIRNRS